MASEIEQLRATVEKLQSQVVRLSGGAEPTITRAYEMLTPHPDQEDIRKLQYTYGYYLDKCLYKEVGEPVRRRNFGGLSQ